MRGPSYVDLSGTFQMRLGLLGGRTTNHMSNNANNAANDGLGDG
jgi:hypothetical protein